MSSKEKYLFGPVPSRRLGLSLGVDIVPLKTCTQNCLYCQLGMDTPQTLERKAYAPIAEVLDEIRQRIASGLKADYITISGSGEPTLHAELGQLIDSIHQVTPIPVAVITNGSLLWRQDVRTDCAKADVVLPSLDAGDAETFQKINQPHPEIHFERFIDGLVQFRQAYSGQIWLEVFICEGINTSELSLKNIGNIIGRIKPDKVQLNTAVRPTAHPHIRPESPAKMDEIARQLGHGAEVIADFPQNKSGLSVCTPESVLELLRRRPCSLKDICASLGAKEDFVQQILDKLAHLRHITPENRDGITFFKPRN
jgi:wyosine [tRNA(Phe)-imidazoG37] synthetase (radical SAM superfamily)